MGEEGAARARSDGGQNRAHGLSRLAARFLRWRHARTAVQAPLLAVAGLMVLDGLAGPQLAPKNLATVLTWVHYRGLAMLALLLAGNLFCLGCPFMLVRNGVRRWVHPVRSWPRRLRSKWPAIGLFIAVLYVYELLDLWAAPRWTAWLIVAYFVGAVAVDGLFRGAPFCKYVCPLGQFNFVAATVSPLEIRTRDAAACAACETKDCIKGRAGQRGCELGLYQPLKTGNLDCTFCLDCVHACPHDNVGLAARLPGSELWLDPVRSGIGRLSRRPDLAALAVVFTFGALVNAFGMVTPVYAVEDWIAGVLHSRSEAVVLGLIFVAGLGLAPALVLGGAGLVARRPGSAARQAWALAPLGLGLWAAHYSYHFVTGAATIIPVVQSFVADVTGRPLLGAPRWGLGPLLPQGWLGPLQIGLLGLGWLGSLLVAYRVAGRDEPGRAPAAFWPWAAALTALLVLAVWLMSQPMEMRGVLLGG